ncbi:hypothetical protein [Rothia sp. P4278]|uniref:hypothetical protein n=1 Tax=Rothia sp. P4278 TaxID=3402658 RepID=UPI003AD87CD4
MFSSFFLDLWSFFKTESAPVTAITAILGVLFAVLNLRKLAQDSHDRTRPYIALEPRLGVQLNGAIDLVVTNYGQSPAQNVVLRPLEKFEPGDDEYILERLEKVLNRPFYIAPNASFRVMWRSIYLGNDSGAPEVVQVEVTYQDTKKRLFRKSRTYREILTVDTGFAVATPLPSQGPRRTSGKESEKALVNIANALRTLNQHIGNRY